MIVRSIDSQNDWTFGQGKNNYKKNNAAISQCIQTRLQSFLGNCFFDVTAGIDWLNFMGGSKNQLAINLAISAVILNTPNVTGILQLSANLTENRIFTVVYKVQTVYSIASNTFQYDLVSSSSAN